MSEIEVFAGEAPVPFTRGGLACYRLTEPEGMICWIAGDARGCITFKVMPAPAIHGRQIYGAIQIGAHWWMGVDVGRHTPKPVAEWDTGHGPSKDGCEYLDGMPCYYDGSGLQAMQLLQRVAAAGTEDAIWAELAEYFSAWIIREGASS